MKAYSFLKNKFFDMSDKFKEQGLTFDDILLVPRKSEVLPAEVSLTTRLTKNIKLNIPIVSADMDTVTEHRLAIALALEGGIGIIHKNSTIEEQVDEVKKVKRFENGFIKDPVTLGPDDFISEAIKINKTLGYKNIPITDNGKSNGVLSGMITTNDYSLNHANSKVKERMADLKDLLIAEEGISLEEANNLLIEKKVARLLVVNNKSENKLVSLVTKTDIEKNEQFPLAVKDEHKRLRVGAAVGPSEDFKERVKALVDVEVDVIAVSTAHGHSKNVLEAVEYIKNNFEVDVIAGNVVTPEGVDDLISAGADAIKVGVGPGSICTTRVVAGVGVPQITAVINCFEAARKKDIPIIADGGIRYSGDIAKALAVGAESVMFGSLLAGVEESPGEIIYLEGKTYKKYRGMGSEGALKKGSRERYGVGEEEKIVPQGIEGRVSYKGKLSDEIFQLVGGVKASLGFIGAKNLEEFREKAKFIKITSASAAENHPHDVTITKEAANYRRNK